MSTIEQRWKDGVDSYASTAHGVVINPRAFEVAPIAGDNEPKAFVLKHHYSATYPAARFRHGLYRGGDLVGVAIFSHPCQDKVLTNALPITEATDGVELGRFVLLDGVAKNGETWFLARCFELLRREGLAGVVSFSDPRPRMRADGSTGFRGHIGTIYQAFNGRYTGRGTARTLKLLPDGTVLSDRALQKIRKRERGWRYAVAQLVAAGAPLFIDGMDPLAWLHQNALAVCRNVRHAGNHRYVWPLSKAIARRLPESRSYPSQIDGGIP